MTSRRINVKEAAAYLGVSKSALDKWRMSPEARAYQHQHYGWAATDGPPFIRIGRRIVYDTANLDQWMGVAQNSAQNPAQNPDVWDVGP
jgi:predicted DNA-binding transcriptional regulator AlpA